jgi:hypothetical protein
MAARASLMAGWSPGEQRGLLGRRSMLGSDISKLSRFGCEEHGRHR